MEDYDRFERMFLTPPPPNLSEVVDADEPEIRNSNSLALLSQLAAKALHEKGTDENPELVAHFLWSVVQIRIKMRS